MPGEATSDTRTFCLAPVVLRVRKQQGLEGLRTWFRSKTLDFRLSNFDIPECELLHALPTANLNIR